MIFFERTIRFLQKLWRTARRRTCRFAVRYTLFVLYYAVLPIIGRTGSKLLLKKPTDNSLWTDTPAETLHITSFGKKQGWLGDLLRWSAKSGNGWMIALLPFIAVLACCAEEADASPASLFIYTLY